MTIRKTSYCQSCIRRDDGTMKATTILERVFWLCGRCRDPLGRETYDAGGKGREGLTARRQTVFRRRPVARV